jgi:hypothetical protein
VNYLARWTLVGSLLIAGCSGATAASPAAQVPFAPVPAEVAATTSDSTAVAATSSEAVAVADPSADAWTRLGRRAPGYLDIVAAEVVRAGDGTFLFVQTLASALPESPSVLAGETDVGWAVCIDVYPFVVSPLLGQVTLGGSCQFIVRTSWDGARFSGELLDHRSVGVADAAASLPFDPVVDGTSVLMAIPAAALGDPTWFLWSVFTEELGSLGPSAAHHVDAAPGGGAGTPLAWPAD